MAPADARTQNEPPAGDGCPRPRLDGDVVLGVTATVTLSPHLERGTPPLAEGAQRCLVRFKPRFVRVREHVEATYRGDGLPDLTVYEYVPDAADLALVGAFFGSRNCLAAAPAFDVSVSCAHLDGVSWPTVEAGSTVSFNLGVERSALGRARLPPHLAAQPRAAATSPLSKLVSRLPRARLYDPTPVAVTVSARVSLVGDVLGHGDA